MPAALLVPAALLLQRDGIQIKYFSQKHILFCQNQTRAVVVNLMVRESDLYPKD